MVTRDLSSERIVSGTALLKRLASARVKVDAALWLYSPEAEDWQLVLSLPRVRRQGPMAGYTVIQDVLREMPDTERVLPLDDITVSPQYEKLVKGLRRVVKKRAAAGIRISHNIVNGMYVEDAYIYRLM